MDGDFLVSQLLQWEDKEELAEEPHQPPLLWISWPALGCLGPVCWTSLFPAS